MSTDGKFKRSALRAVLQQGAGSATNTTTEAVADTPAAEAPSVPTPPRAKKTGTLAKRQQDVADVASGKIKTVKTIQHDPARIRPWAYHNRFYNLLDAESCADLIDNVQVNGQRFPAIVRKIEDDNFDYEFICGARRHWVASYLGKDLLIEVRNIDDREAFLLQDAENRAREDVSDYERGLDYHRALNELFAGNVSRLASELGYKYEALRRYVLMAEMPECVVKSYQDVREFKIHHALAYTNLLKDKDRKGAFIAAAEELAKSPVSGVEVYKALNGAGKTKPAKAPAKSYADGMVKLTSKGKGKYSVEFKLPPKQTEADFETLGKAFRALIGDLKQ